MSKHLYPKVRVAIEPDNPAIMRVEENCIQCGACVENCPKKCLIMNNQYSNVVVKNDLEIVKDTDNSVDIEG